MRTTLGAACAMLLCAGFTGTLRAQTDGSVTFNYQLYQDSGSYAPKHVVAVWVTTSSGTFIKTLRKDGSGWSGTGTKHLNQWQSARSSSQFIDGYSGATITTYNATTVTWNCRNTNNVLVADGTYKFWVEFTEDNGQGPYTAGGLAWTKGSNVYSNNYADQTYIKGLKVVFTPTVTPHDLAVLSISPSAVPTNATSTIRVAVTNKTTTAESFSVLLSNLTTATLIGTQPIGSLAGKTLTNVPFSWNTAGLEGPYAFQATAGPVVGETSTNDNTVSGTVLVQYIPHDLAVIRVTPSLVQAHTNATMTVTVTNKATSTETFSVVLSNLTTRSLIGTQLVTSLAGGGVTNVALVWSTPSVSSNYLVQATAGPVASENITDDNVFSATVTVRPMWHDLAILGTTMRALVLEQNTNLANAPGWQTSLYSINDDGTNQSVTVAAPVPAPLFFRLRSVSQGATASALTVRRNGAGILVSWPSAFSAFVTPDTTNFVSILVTNKGDFTDSFAVLLFDDTDARLIGSNMVSSVAVATATNLTVTWLTTNSLYGYHTLRAVVNAVSGETNLLNNTNFVSTVVANGWATNTFIAKAGVWRYSDEGLDLSFTPWRAPGYYDSVWKQGAAPLGYSESGRLTNLTTFLSWGSASTNKNPTSYFRQAFNADVLPSSLTLNVRCVDGVALYLNGAELARFNMSTGAMAFTNLAASAVVGPDQYTYFTSNVVPTNLVLGQNVLAAEVHRADLTGSDLAFDMEMLGAVPQFPFTHSVDALELTPVGDVIAGDKMSLTVTLTNRGNATETVLVLLKNNATGQILGSQTITEVHPGDWPAVTLEWATLGASGGTNQLVAYTVVSGVTNLAGAFTNTAVVSGSGFGLNAANAAAAIGGRCAAVATYGDLLLVGAGATLEVWDRSSPVAPVKQAALRLPGPIEGIAASGSYAFAACGSAGVQFVDLAAPARPVQRATFNTSGHACAVALSGTHLYVADGVAGIRVVNVANPASPSLAGAFHTAGPARAVTISGATAYVLDEHQGLLVLDISNPGAPSLMGSYAGVSAGQSLAVSGPRACIVDGNNHFLVVDVSSPATPVLTGSLLLDNTVGQAVLQDGSTAYVAAGGSGLLVIDVSTPAAPMLVSTILMPGEATALALASSKLYVADGLAGFQIFDLASPGFPALRSDFLTVLRAADIISTNDLAYVAAGENGLHIYSLTNLWSPRLISRCVGVTNARAIALSGTTAYVGDGQYGLKIINVADPAAPVLLGSYTNASMGSIRNVGASGSLAVISDGRTLLLVDASTPANPSLVGTYSSTNFVFSLAAANSKAYLATSFGLVILNMIPNAFTVAGSYYNAFPATGISVSGTNAYVAYGTRVWRVFDVSNPSSPRVVTSSSAQGPVFDLAVAGTNVTLVTATNIAAVMDVSVPLTPVRTRSFGPLVRSVRLTATANLTLVAEDEVGLTLFANSEDLDGDGLPDWWEQQIIAASSATNGPIHSIAEVLPNDDFDGDGASNYAEYLAGTSPVDLHSAFMMVAQPSTNSTSFNIKWYSVAGKTYTIYKSTDLKAGFSIFMDNIAATPPLNAQPDSTTNHAAFYIIGVR